MYIAIEGKLWNTARLQELVKEQPHEPNVRLSAYQVADGRVLVIRHVTEAYFADDGDLPALGEQYGGALADLAPVGE